MAVPGASPLADMQLAYKQLVAAIRDMTISPQPTYALPGGASASWETYFAALCARRDELAKIPGIDPDPNGTQPVFEIFA